MFWRHIASLQPGSYLSSSTALLDRGLCRDLMQSLVLAAILLGLLLHGVLQNCGSAWHVHVSYSLFCRQLKDKCVTLLLSKRLQTDITWYKREQNISLRMRCFDGTVSEMLCFGQIWFKFCCQKYSTQRSLEWEEPKYCRGIKLIILFPPYIIWKGAGSHKIYVPSELWFFTRKR